MVAIVAELRGTQRVDRRGLGLLIVKTVRMSTSKTSWKELFRKGQEVNAGMKLCSSGFLFPSAKLRGSINERFT